MTVEGSKNPQIEPDKIWHNFPDHRLIQNIATTVAQAQGIVNSWIDIRPTMQKKIDMPGGGSERIYIDWAVRDRNYSIQAVLESLEFYESVLKNNEENTLYEVGDTLFYLLLSRQYVINLEDLDTPDEILDEVYKSGFESLFKKLGIGKLSAETGILLSVAEYGRQTIGMDSDSVFGDIEIIERSENEEDIEIIDYKFQSLCLCLYTIYTYLSIKKKDPLSLVREVEAKNNVNFPPDLFNYKSPFIFDSDGISCCRLFRKALPKGMATFKNALENSFFNSSEKAGEKEILRYRWSIKKLLSDIAEDTNTRPLFRNSAESLLNSGQWNNQPLDLK